MIKNIGVLVSMLLAFHFNVGGADISKCDDETDWSKIRQCQVKECGYGEDPRICAPYDFLYYGAVASKTGIALLVFIIFLIIIHIAKEVNLQNIYITRIN